MAVARNTGFEIGLLAASPDCVLVLSIQGRIEFINERGLELVQLSDPITIVGLELAALCPEPERAKVRDAVARAANGETVRMSGFRPTVRGESRWWEASFAAFQPADADEPKLVCIARDVTDRFAAEEALRTSEAQLRDSERRLDALVRSSSEVRFSISADWSELYQLAGGNFIPDTSTANSNWLNEYIPPEDRDALRTEYERAIRTRTPYDIEHRVNRVDGTVGWALTRAVPLIDEKGDITSWLGAAADVTQRKRAETALKELNATLELEIGKRTTERNRLWQNSLDLLAVLEPSGKFLSVNPAWEALLGWPAEEVVGKSLASLVHPDDRSGTLAVFAAVMDAPLAQPHAYRVLCKDKSFRWVAWNAVFEEDRVYANGRDITAEKEQAAALASVEAALRQSQKMEAIGQLTGGVAHDFNNVLAIIKTSNDLLRRVKATDDRRQRFMDSISQAVERASKLTGQLLAFARRQALQPTVFDARQNVRSVSEMIASLTQVGVEVVAEIADAACYIYADSSQFDTALVNLSVNGRDAMGQAGKLILSIEEVDHIPSAAGEAAVTGAYVAVAVTDDGTGISPDHINQIFEPFFTTKGVGHGTGLGLSQVYGFAKQSGGDIRVSSTLGKGSTFTLYLPRTATVPVLAAEHQQDDEIPLGAGGWVLVVEDNRELAVSVQHTFEELGYRVTPVLSAEEALRELELSPARFVAVFTDVVMAGMSGIDLGREIRKLYGSLPVVLASGYSHVLAKTAEHGFPLLQKPYSIDALASALHQAIHRKDGRPAQRRNMPLPAGIGIPDKLAGIEDARLAVLTSLGILDTAEDDAYDELAGLAAKFCDTPMALISLVDGTRQWFKARVGVEVRETLREYAFCAHAIQVPEHLMVISDASKDERFSSNPLVTGYPHIRFYAGAPLVTSSGHALGTLSVLDTVPRDLTARQLELLKFLAGRVVDRIETFGAEAVTKGEASVSSVRGSSC